MKTVRLIELNEEMLNSALQTFLQSLSLINDDEVVSNTGWYEPGKLRVYLTKE